MIHVLMRGLLEHVEVDADETEFLNEANLAAAQGKEFLLLRAPEGEMVGINVRNILTFREVEESANLMG